MAETVADIPALAALWDPERNEQPAADVLARSYRTAWWKCPSGHSFERKPRMMSSDPSCPHCALDGASLVDFLDRHVSTSSSSTRSTSRSSAMRTR